MSIIERFVLVLSIAALIFVLFLMNEVSGLSDACKEAGGEMVRTHGGFVCAELKRIK